LTAERLAAERFTGKANETTKYEIKNSNSNSNINKQLQI
jgi:hypothetical protein